MRPFAESVTGFASRYRSDIFYRTGWNVVLLQIGFAAALLVTMLLALSAMYDEVVVALVQSISDSIAQGVAAGTAPRLDTSLIYSLEYEKQRAMVISAAGILTLAATFGYLITRIALVPTGNALKSQKQFIGNVAHELRTPLSIIKTNTEVALFNETLDTDTADTLRSNVEELNRISDIINNLLSMSAFLRPEKVVFSNVDVNAVIDRVESTYADLVEHRKVGVTITKSEHHMIWGNAPAVEQMLGNVFKNAVNCTLEGGHVSIETEENFRGQLEIIIKDTGIGISEKDLQHIFEPFYRGDQSRTRISGSSGLGLAIVSELVKIHKGTIIITSEVGKGTTVRIALPNGHKHTREKPTDEGSKEVRIDFSKKLF